jgi:hypothetical protein
MASVRPRGLHDDRWVHAFGRSLRGIAQECGAPACSSRSSSTCSNSADLDRDSGFGGGETVATARAPGIHRTTFAR